MNCQQDSLGSGLFWVLATCKIHSIKLLSFLLTNFAVLAPSSQLVFCRWEVSMDGQAGNGFSSLKVLSLVLLVLHHGSWCLHLHAKPRVVDAERLVGSLMLRRRSWSTVCSEMIPPRETWTTDKLFPGKVSSSLFLIMICGQTTS